MNEKNLEKENISITSSNSINKLYSYSKIEEEAKSVRHNKIDLEQNSGNKNYLNYSQEQEETNNIKSPYSLNLIQIAGDCFDYYVNSIRSKKNLIDIDLYEVKNLLEVIGIKKNEYEIRNKIFELKNEQMKKFKEDEKYSKQNFCDIVEGFKQYRIDDKLLVEVFRHIDTENEGIINMNKLIRINKEIGLNFTDEEMKDILEFFELEEKFFIKDKKVKEEINHKPYSYGNSNKNVTMDFEKFCKLYYQG